MKTLALVFVLALTVGCASVADPCRDPETVPVPYWDPPANVQPLQPSPIYLSPDTPTPTNEAEAEAAVEALVTDLLAAATDAEECRHRYSALVERIMTEVPPPL